MAELSFPSFAKINWILKILGKRPDGFHEVRTVLQTVDLRDRIRLEAVPGDEISLRTRGRTVAQGEDNLLVKTARLLQGRFGVKKGLRMQLDKRIPVGAGLGGGSANAAVLLLALNRVWDLGLEAATLREAAAELGSDVPFFLCGGTALGRGRGELLTPLPDPAPARLLLFYPGVEISAREAYQKGGWGSLPKGSELTSKPADTTILRFCTTAERGQSVQDLAENDFDRPMFSHYPLLAEAREALSRAGCERVMLCGSGSTLLGLAAARKLDSIAAAVSRERLGEVLICRTLSRSRYREILGKESLALAF